MSLVKMGRKPKIYEFLIYRSVRDEATGVFYRKPHRINYYTIKPYDCEDN